MTSASTFEVPRSDTTRSWAILQFEIWIDDAPCGVPSAAGPNEGPRLQLPMPTEAIRELMQGMFGHLSSSTRVLPRWGLNFFHGGVIGGAVTVTSGSPRADMSAPKAPDEQAITSSTRVPDSLSVTRIANLPRSYGLSARQIIDQNRRSNPAIPRVRARPVAACKARVPPGRQ